LFEAEDRLGGHSNTVEMQLEGRSFPVDTGFLVFNDRTYPNLIALFETLGVRSVESSMTFSVQAEGGQVEWCGTDLSTVFAQKRNLLRPRFLRMLADLLRCNRELTAAHLNGTLGDERLGDWLDRAGYGQAVRDWYLVPMTAAIWSTPPSRALDYPVATFAQFCHNHGLLTVNDRPRWRTVQGGSREYVRRLAAGITAVRTGARVETVRRSGQGVQVHCAGQAPETFDQVVLACHSDQQLKMLADADAAERGVLERVRYQRNTAVLHTDASFLPRHRRAWAAWNYHVGASGTDQASVSYLLNELQPLPVQAPVLVTLNPLRAPDPSLVHAGFDYEHPLFDGAAISAQRELAALQGRRQTWFAGAWTRYGFHEDGLLSGLQVAQGLGALVPWSSSVT
jgi:predicted NAD/FAD-binding protein